MVCWISGAEDCARGVALRGDSGLGEEVWVEDCCCDARQAVWCRQARCGRAAADEMEVGAVKRRSEAKLRNTDRENMLTNSFLRIEGIGGLVD